MAYEQAYWHATKSADLNGIPSVPGTMVLLDAWHHVSDKISKRLHAFAANEALLIHGTNLEVAQKIAEQGFDPRHLHGIYGRGIYFTHDL